MAISGGDGSIILTTKIDETGLKKGFASMRNFVGKIGKSFAVIGAAAATAMVAITKMAVSAYADYEQLVGGVETLFKGSADKVKAYASDAFFTAGVSANEYMQQVTSFSASLIRSTAGDTDKAADIANMALIDISDNVNKMGSSMESVTLAYQGFAKQQYMLLDNLKLGYGGTKTEMERLLKAAQALTGVKYDINNLADVYSAIHAIQEELGITGTTAKEAEKTITGSANMMKAAWQNVLSAIAGGGDVDRAIQNLAYSVSKYFENIVPVIQKALSGVGQLIAKIAPMLVQTVASSLIKAIPNLLYAVYQMIIGLAKGIRDGITALFTGGSGSVTAQINTGVEGVASSIDNASSGMQSLGDATEEAGKKAKKSLAGFDDLQILADNASTASDVSAPEVAVPSVGTTEFSVDTSVTEEAFQPPEAFMTFVGKLKELLTPTFDLIKKCVDATKEWASGVNFDPLMNSLSNLWEQLKSQNKEIHDTLYFIYTDVLLPIAQWAAESLLPVVFNMAAEAMRSMTSAMTPVRKGFGKLIDKIKPVTDFIGNVVVGIFDFFRQVFAKVADVFEEKGTKIQEIISGIGDIIQVVWSVVGPILEMVWFVVEKLFTFIAEIVGSVLGFVIDVIWGVVEFIAGVFTGDWERAWEGIKGIFVGIWDFICNILSGLWDFLKGIFEPIINWIDEKVVQPIASFFSNLWEGIKNGLKAFVNFFIDIINGLIGGFESFVNFFVDGINSVVKALNKLSFKVPDWVPEIGGKKFGFNLKTVDKVSIGRIPRLAQGAVIPGGREFLAVLGDQPKGQTNIEAPLQTIVDAFNIALQGNANYGGGNTEVVLEIDGREFGRAVVEQGNRENRRIGTRLVIA